MKEYREANPDLMKEKSHAWYVKNREKAISRAAEWAKKNPEKILEAQRRYYRAHRALELQRSKAMRQTPEGKMQAMQRVRKYQATAKYKAWLEAYRLSDTYKHHRKSQKAKRRAPNIVRTLTQTEWNNILSFFEHRCAYCGQSGKLEQDHYVPIAKGGHHTKENVVPACRSCNAKKSARHPHKLF